jgi:hypothetical protein
LRVSDRGRNGGAPGSNGNRRTSNRNIPINLGSDRTFYPSDRTSNRNDCRNSGCDRTSNWDALTFWRNDRTSNPSDRTLSTSDRRILGRDRSSNWDWGLARGRDRSSNWDRGLARGRDRGSNWDRGLARGRDRIRNEGWHRWGIEGCRGWGRVCVGCIDTRKNISGLIEESPVNWTRSRLGERWQQERSTFEKRNATGDKTHAKVETLLSSSLGN